MGAFRLFLVLTALCFAAVPGWGVEIRRVDGGPIHEGFVTPVTGTGVLDAIPTEPPAPITEHIPGQGSEHQEWVPGYWAWSTSENDFVWVSGVWRCTPPGKIWIPGFWKQLDEGWVWLRGFWSAQPSDQLQYLAETPPDPEEENIGNAPSPDHFWAPGYWAYDQSSNDYQWHGGEWELFDPNWIYVPAYYVWRPEGWVFVQPYWDWPSNTCGRAYACIWIPLHLRPGFIYEPIWILEPLIILKTCYALYPDYLYWCHHHWHYQPDFWNDCGCAPTWWHWDDWWCLPWHDQWAVWWWWSHPGYPHPVWLNKHAAEMIAPPKHNVFEWVKHAVPPPIVLPNGVVPSQQLFKAVNQVVKNKSGKFAPVIPSNKILLQQVQNKALTKTVIPHNILKPNGKKDDWQKAPEAIKKLPLQLADEKGKQGKHGLRIQMPNKDLLPKIAPVFKIDQQPLRKKDRPPIRIIDIEHGKDEKTPPHDRLELEKHRQDQLEQLRQHQLNKQLQLQQRHTEKLDRIRRKQQQESLELQKKNDQRVQWQQQQHQEELQSRQLRQQEKQARQQFKHEQQLEFHRRQQEMEQQKHSLYLQQMQQQQEQQHRMQKDQQQQIEQLQQYRMQQEQQHEERIKRLQHFRQPQAAHQLTPYVPESRKHDRDK